MDKKEIKSVWAAFQEVQEAKNKKKEELDPVGKEDDDVDNDGDTDSSDEYLKNRRKAVGKAMKKEGKIPPQFLKNVKKKDDDSDDDSGDKEEKGKKPEKGVNPFTKKKDDDKEQKEGKIPPQFLKNVKKKKGEKDDSDEKDVEEAKKVDCPKCDSKGCDHCDDKGYHMKEDYEYFVENLSDEELDEYIDWLNEEEQLDELSPELKRRAAVKAADKSGHHTAMHQKRGRQFDRTVSKHGLDGRTNSSKPAQHATKLDKSSSKHGQMAKKRMGQAQKFAKSAGHSNVGQAREAFDIIDQVLEARQFARLETVLSSSELAAIEEKMKQPNDSGTKAEPFMSTSSPKEKKVFADHEKGSNKDYEDWEEKSEIDAANAGKAVKSQSPKRRGESRKGDNAMPTPTKAKGQ